MVSVQEIMEILDVIPIVNIPASDDRSESNKSIGLLIKIQKLNNLP